MTAQAKPYVDAGRIDVKDFSDFCQQNMQSDPPKVFQTGVNKLYSIVGHGSVVLHAASADEVYTILMRRFESYD